MKHPRDSLQSCSRAPTGASTRVPVEKNSSIEGAKRDRREGPISPGPIAHSENESGQTHGLVEHLTEVSRLARRFACKFGGHQLAGYLGLWHDLGKFHPQWQQYVRAEHRGGGLDHKWAGAKMATDCAGMASLAALVVHGHHGGLKSRSFVRNFLADEDLSLRGRKALEAARDAMSGLDPPETTQLLPEHATRNCIQLEFFLRMVFSCLVDADYLDTERHFKPQDSAQRVEAVSIASLRGVLDQHCWARFSAKSGTVNDVRRAIREDCLTAARGASGRYCLTAPTGSGKTLSVMAFALEHAALRGMERVIYAAPFISVTSQTATAFRDALERGADAVSPTEHAAETLRSALGGSVVLEHHSNAAWQGEDIESAPWARWSELSSENWDSRVIVTTTVQLLESMFSNRPGKCRKNHRMANAVIVLDEAQSIPHHITVPSVDGLRSLTDDYGSTVVLATATQPAFESIPGLDGFKPTEIVGGGDEHFETLRRVSYRWNHAEERSWSEIAHEMMVAPRGAALAIVNTRSHARLLWEALRDIGAPEPMLLSTRLCSRHRRKVEESVRQRLMHHKRCLLVSTQIVEAGVDLDFPAVWREFAPLPSLAQAAGRCNREGRLEDLGTLTVFRAAGASGTGVAVYGPAIGVTERIVSSPDFDGDRPERAIARYFDDLYGLLAAGGNLDPHGIQDQRQNGSFPFERIAKDFRVIEDTQHPVSITTFERHPEVVGWLQELDHMAHDSSGRDPARARRLHRKLQPYLVNLRRQEFEGARDNGLTGELGSYSGFPEWAGRYDPDAGLILE